MRRAGDAEAHGSYGFFLCESVGESRLGCAGSQRVIRFI